MTKSAILFTLSPAACVAPLALLVTMALMLAAPAMAHAPHLLVFDPPGTIKKNSTICDGYCGTEGLAMNDEGTITGFYVDDKVVPHGFLRTADGKYTTFEAPNAGTAPYLNQGTVAYTINNCGEVGGQYEDADNVFHGFIRYPDNHYEVVDDPDADTKKGSEHGTQVYSNNDEGEVAGIYVDAKGYEYSFFRSRERVISSILPEKDALEVSVCEETCLNRQGTTVGSYVTSKAIFRGFLRTREGHITTFAAPGAGTSQYTGTIVASISPEGEIAGYLVDDAGIYHGFVRHCDGTFSKDFEVPEAYVAANSGTAPFAINASGLTTGIYFDTSGALHGFERTPSEFVAIIGGPKSAAGTGPGQGTRPSVNNIEGKVAGWTIDGTGLLHGFLWVP